ncbi:MAG: DUF371 domain-containing protein [Methanobacteriota archaeon]
MVETIISYGHENITSKHATTLEITKDKEITKNADCIIGVKADKGISELSENFKQNARNEKSVIKVVLQAGNITETIIGRGHPDLSFSHETDIVIRKSAFICPRTLMIKADKSARELDRRLINLLKDRKQKLIVEISIVENLPEGKFSYD